MFNPDDYIPMKWRIDEVPANVRITEKFPDLENIFREYLNDLATDELSADVVMRFIVLCYHKNSPFVRGISNIGQRKVQAWIKSGANPQSNDVKDISGNINKKVQLAILQFLKFEQDGAYLSLVYRQEAYHRLNIEMSSGGTKFSAATYKSLQQMEEDITRLSEKAFSGDTALLNNFATAQIYENRKLSPEQWANTN